MSWAVALGCTESQLSVTAPQSSKCQVSAKSNQSTFPYGGGSGSIEVITTRDCTWTIQAEASWIELEGERSHSGQGEAVVDYAVEANTAPVERSGMLVIADARIQIAQAGAPCRFELRPSREVVPPSGGSVSVEVATSEGCAWSASSQDAWITVTSSRQGTGSGTVVLAVARNEGASRTGSVEIAGNRVTVEQTAGDGPHRAPPPPSPAPEGPIELEGKVAQLFGSCPFVTFQLADRSVSTNSGTDYRDGRCRDLSNGDVLTVQGTAQVGGGFLADLIRFKDGGRNNADDDE